jgi:hypothetical protein
MTMSDISCSEWNKLPLFFCSDWDRLHMLPKGWSKIIYIHQVNLIINITNGTSYFYDTSLNVYYILIPTRIFIYDPHTSICIKRC